MNPRIVSFVLILIGLSSMLKAQPQYWQFSYHELIKNVRLGMREHEVISNIAKAKKQFGKYAFNRQQVYFDSAVGYVDHVTITGAYELEDVHKLWEWFNPDEMIANYSILLINKKVVRITLYFLYPDFEIGKIDISYTELADFFSQVGWYPFCSHPLWDLDVKCGYQVNYVPGFEDSYGEDKHIRMYRYRLKLTKGLCISQEYTINESIGISFSDAQFLQEALQLNSIEKAAFYGTAYLDFGLDKRIQGCVVP